MRKRSKLKCDPISFFHIHCSKCMFTCTRWEIAEVQTAQGKLFLFVGIDRTSKFAVPQLVEEADRKTIYSQSMSFDMIYEGEALSTIGPRTMLERDRPLIHRFRNYRRGPIQRWSLIQPTKIWIKNRANSVKARKISTHSYCCGQFVGRGKYEWWFTLDLCQSGGDTSRFLRRHCMWDLSNENSRPHRRPCHQAAARSSSVSPLWPEILYLRPGANGEMLRG